VLALVGAALTVINIMPSALSATSLADIGAYATKFLHELRAAAHEACRGPAHRRAVFVEPNALGHHGDIAFTQASLGAVLAFLGAANASIDARLVLFVGHDYLLRRKKGNNCLTMARMGTFAKRPHVCRPIDKKMPCRICNPHF
jgi:hypothetical protein